MRVFSLLALILAADAVSYNQLMLQEWNLYKVQHRKNYSSELEESYRMKVYLANKAEIIKHNARYEQGLETYTQGINQFSDLLPHEFLSTLKRMVRPEHSIGNHSLFMKPAHVKAPDTVDWRTEGAVTPVKDQGQCGSCWAFSATGSLEGQHFRSSGKLVSLSEQNLIDCSGKYNNHGCNGGVMDAAFKYIEDNGGIDTEESYPYEGKDNSCRYKADTKGATVSGIVDVKKGHEDDLKSAVATVGPVSVGIEVTIKFQKYTGGIMYDPKCSDNINHGVLVVGYGTEKNQDYWLVKNSWGEKWGEHGYIKMARNKSNNCGIASMASYPTVN